PCILLVGLTEPCFTMLTTSSLTTIRRPPSSPLFPYTTLFRSHLGMELHGVPPLRDVLNGGHGVCGLRGQLEAGRQFERFVAVRQDRKSTRLNSSHGSISYAVFCLKKKREEEVIVSQNLSTGAH